MMTVMTCPECAAEMSDQAAACPKCGHRNRVATAVTKRAAISGLGGKMKAIGTIMIASAVVATAVGFWWGPALLLPGVAVFMFGVAA